MDLSCILFSVWFLGTLTVLGWQARRTFTFGRVVSTSLPAPAGLRAEVRRMSRLMRVRPIHAVTHGRVQSPFLWCFPGMRLVWPNRSPTAFHSKDPEFYWLMNWRMCGVATVDRHARFCRWSDLVVESSVLLRAPKNHGSGRDVLRRYRCTTISESAPKLCRVVLGTFVVPKIRGTDTCLGSQRRYPFIL